MSELVTLFSALGVTIAVVAMAIRLVIDGSRMQGDTHRRDIFDRLDDAALTAVSAVEQTFVRPRKAASEGGRLSAEDRAEAMAAARAIAETLLGPRWIEEFDVVVVSTGHDSEETTRSCLNAKLEAAVYRATDSQGG